MRVANVGVGPALNIRPSFTPPEGASWKLEMLGVEYLRMLSAGESKEISVDFNRLRIVLDAMDLEEPVYGELRASCADVFGREFFTRTSVKSSDNMMLGETEVGVITEANDRFSAWIIDFVRNWKGKIEKSAEVNPAR
jgi:hypothetical protein